MIPPGARFVVVEAAETMPWCAVVGADALRIGLSRFGASAPYEDLARELGFTPRAVADRVAGWLRSR